MFLDGGLQTLCLRFGDDDLIKAVDMMKFDLGETEIRVKE